MKILIVGGSGQKSSSIVSKMAEILDFHSSVPATVHNGGTLPRSIEGNELILWMPDIDNELEKAYPVKDKGAVLICSKVMREGYTRLDAVERIFKMHGNAVIAIYKQERNCNSCLRDNGTVMGCKTYGKACLYSNNFKHYAPLPRSYFKFELIDALGNVWCSTRVIGELCCAIKDLTGWTKASIREGLERSTLIKAVDFSSELKNELNAFVEINKKLAYKVAGQCGNRYFGNYSTRCTKLFPSLRKDTAVFVSPRNIDKRTITIDDMVLVVGRKYVGERKPSVDTPVQLQLYENHDGVNFMVHGHAYITGNVPTTVNYYPCGDLRETKEVTDLLAKGHRRINLLNHGFLIAASTIDGLKALSENSSFRQLNVV